MKIIFYLLFAAIVLLLGTTLSLLIWAGMYVFRTSTSMGFTYLIGVTISATFLIILGWWWYKTELPKIWRSLAEKEKFITLAPEKHFVPIERAGRFVWGFKCEGGLIILLIPRPSRQAGDPCLITVMPENIFSGLDLILYHYFVGQGYVWLGFDASSQGTTRVGSLAIPKARLQKREGLDEVQIKVEPIKALRLTFQRYVVVSEIETTDGHKLRLLALAIVTVTDPYLAWYGLGGKAYETLDTIVATLIRTEGEKHSLVSMYQSGANGQDEIEEEIKEGSIETERKLGMKITLTIEEWEDDAGPGFRIFIGRVQTAQQETANQIAEMEMRIRIAEKKGDELAAQALLEVERAKLEIQRKLANEEEYKALLALAGGKEDAVIHIVLKQQLGDDLYKKYVDADALKHTKVQVLGTNATPLINLPQPPTQP